MKKKKKKYVSVKLNPCTQMAIRFSAEMKIESKNYNVPILIYSKIEKKKFNTTYYFLLFSFKLREKKNVKFLFNSF